MTLDKLHEIVCMVEGIPLATIKAQSRKWGVLKYRRAFTVVARFDYGFGVEAIADYLWQDHSTICHTTKQFAIEKGEKIEELKRIVSRIRNMDEHKSKSNLYIYVGLNGHKYSQLPKLRKKIDEWDITRGMAKVLKELREDPEISTKWLARKTGYAVATVQNYKRRLHLRGYV